MKLTAKTRDMVKAGTRLKDGIGIFTVVFIYEYNRGKCVQLRDKYGRTIYGYPLSKCYGMEILPEAGPDPQQCGP